MKVIAYYRIGNKEQRIDALKAKLELFASDRGLVISETFVDYGYSSNQERPKFNKVKELLKNGGTTLITLTADRMYRNPSDLLELMTSAKNAGSRIITANGSIDTDNEETKLALSIHEAIDELINEPERMKRLANVFKKRAEKVEIDQEKMNKLRDSER
jgi:DNA invertase Pin-like site-specific DNA recombinase